MIHFTAIIFQVSSFLLGHCRKIGNSKKLYDKKPREIHAAGYSLFRDPRLKYKPAVRFSPRVISRNLFTAARNRRAVAQTATYQCSCGSAVVVRKGIRKRGILYKSDLQSISSGLHKSHRLTHAWLPDSSVLPPFFFFSSPSRSEAPDSLHILHNFFHGKSTGRRSFWSHTSEDSVNNATAILRIVSFARPRISFRNSPPLWCNARKLAPLKNCSVITRSQTSPLLSGRRMLIGSMNSAAGWCSLARIARVKSTRRLKTTA